MGSTVNARGLSDSISGRGSRIRMDRARWKPIAFVAALAAYYAVYSAIFGRKVGEYFEDVWRHFEFVRRLF